MKNKDFVVLYSSNEIHKEIERIFSKPEKGEERIAIVAYVGEGAESYLPYPDGVKLICCLEPGATSANALGRLRDRGANIMKSDRLHMKVYWSSIKGCVICSANLSDNALGRNGTKEAGVLFGPGVVDIKKLIRNANPKEISNRDLSELHWNAKKLKSGRHQHIGRGQSSEVGFDDWYNGSFREEWKWGWHTTDGEAARAAKEQSKKMYGVPEPEDFLNVQKSQVRQGDWLLCFELPKGDHAQWMFVECVVPVLPDEKKAYDEYYPFQAVQYRKTSHCRLPPFKIDKSFRHALKIAIGEFGPKKIEERKSLLPPKRFLKLLSESMS